MDTTLVCNLGGGLGVWGVSHLLGDANAPLSPTIVPPQSPLYIEKHATQKQRVCCYAECENEFN